MSVAWSTDETEGQIQLATRVPKTLHRAIRLDAIGREQTLSQWITEALAAHLERCKREKPGKAPAAAAR
jgi:predicted HicB family RNase H-like nuclease